MGETTEINYIIGRKRIGKMEEIKTTELNSDIIEKIKKEVPDMIREFMEKDLVKMILYGSCARGDFKDYSDVDIALLMKGSRMDSWVYNDKIDEVATKLALKYFAIVNFVLLPYQEFEEKKGWYGYFKNIEKEGIKLYG
jgi:predicted nucleotidyltransferase